MKLKLFHPSGGDGVVSLDNSLDVASDASCAIAVTSVVYSKYHPGKFLVAWHPKSSEENERTTVVVNNETFGDVLFRQIAGAMAKRIVNYAEAGQEVAQATDSGFIKFGSRVDVFLPLDAKIKVTLNQKVKGGISIIAEK